MHGVGDGILLEIVAFMQVKAREKTPLGNRGAIKLAVGGGRQPCAQERAAEDHPGLLHLYARVYPRYTQK